MIIQSVSFELQGQLQLNQKYETICWLQVTSVTCVAFITAVLLALSPFSLLSSLLSLLALCGHFLQVMHILQTYKITNFVCSVPCICATCCSGCIEACFHILLRLSLLWSNPTSRLPRQGILCTLVLCVSFKMVIFFSFNSLLL